MPTASELIIAQIQREMAEFAAEDDAADAGLAVRSNRRVTGPSVVFSVRLDHGELDALERQAAVRGIKPSAFARNLIRWGLAQQDGAEVDRAFQRLEDAVAALRTVVPN